MTCERIVVLVERRFACQNVSISANVYIWFDSFYIRCSTIQIQKIQIGYVISTAPLTPIVTSGAMTAI